MLTSVRETLVDTHRAWHPKTYEELIEPLDLTDRAAVAEALLVLRVGAMVAGYLGDPRDRPARTCGEARR
ncbi:hypothetical protein ACQEVC_35770 [Plantactinospora sp. CA-294935]|uniref:hypothetical protein n=1 Tax=Plantactinospora sp. CA-294935 TaxID=3240012 RepID=UPI003D8A6672